MGLKVKKNREGANEPPADMAAWRKKAARLHLDPRTHRKLKLKKKGH